MAKDFKKINNPAMQFITIEEETAEATAGEAASNTHNTQHTQDTQKAQETQSTQEAQEPQKKAKKADLKGKRFNLLFYSTDTLESLKKLAVMKQAESVNALINEILTAYTEAQAEEINKYNSLFGK